MKVIKLGKRKKILVPMRTETHPFNASVIAIQDKKYYVVDPNRSKLGAALLRGLAHLPKPDGVTLYLGASAGYTVSFLAQELPLIYAVEYAPSMCRELVFVAEQLGSIAPILGDADHPEEYPKGLKKADYIFQDVSQKAQIRMMARNLKTCGTDDAIGVIALKTLSIDAIKKPQETYEKSLLQVKEHGLQVLQAFSIDDYHKGHYIIVVKK
jgi:fibrillarin-like pre-rRNA processing protein